MAIQTIINLICEQFGVISGRVEVYGDNKDSLVKQHMIPSKMAFPRYFRPNVDAKLQIQALRQHLHPIKILPNHIKSHQDDKVDFDYETAPMSVKLNIEVDNQSKLFLKSHQGSMEPQPSTPSFPAMTTSLSINDSIIQNNLEHHVRLNYFGPQLESRFASKLNLSHQTIKHIHWLAIERAFRKLPLQEKLATFNLLHSKWPTNMKVAGWDCNKNPMCQRCGTIEETFHHVLQCKSQHATKIHDTAIKKLKCSLRRSQTAPIIQRAIVQCILKHRKGYEDLTFNDIVVHDDQKALAAKVFQRQERLGCTAFIQGYMTMDWAIMQNVYNGMSDIMDQQTTWMSKVIKAIWQYSLTMWKERCTYIHGPSSSTKGSKRRQELLSLIDIELERTKLFGDHEIRQLRKNLSKSKGTAQTAALEVWLDMIRKVKESTIMLKRETRLTTTRMQSITRFLCRPAPA